MVTSTPIPSLLPPPNLRNSQNSLQQLQTPQKSVSQISSQNPRSPHQSPKNLDRRNLLLSLTSPLFSSILLSPTNADARGLFQMPPPRLNNRYFLVRAGESEFESFGIINTNPVAKTSVDSGLSEVGKRQTARAAIELKKMEACDGDCWIWPSITQRSYQAAEIIAAVNGVTRSRLHGQNYSDINKVTVKPSAANGSGHITFMDNSIHRLLFSCQTAPKGAFFDVTNKECRIVPEYSFLDARGLGAYEGKSLESLMEVYASDGISPSNKPPPIDDGTPNESVADVFVRVTQLMSITETQYSGDTVIIVSPDSDNLTILQAGLVGLDLRRHSDLSFAPGEVRLVDPKSIPTYKRPASSVYKCMNPPSCT